MFNLLLISSLFFCANASPLMSRQWQYETGWQPASGTSATCDATADKYMSLVIGPEQGDVIFDHACAAFLPGCAYPENLPAGTACTQSIDYPVDGPKNTVLNILVESKHNKLSDWAVDFAIVPGSVPANYAGVFMSRADCKGYFQTLLLETSPIGCYLQGLGPGAGAITVGGNSSLKGTEFNVSFVKRK